MSTFWGGQPTELGASTHWGRSSIGIPFSEIPESGQHGPSLMALDTGLVGTDEVRIYITTVPPNLTLFICYEDGSVEAEGPNGAHYGERSSASNGVDYTVEGTDDFEIIFGSVLDGDAQIDVLSSSGDLTGGVASEVTGDAVFSDVESSGTMTEGIPSVVSGDAAFGDITSSGGLGLFSAMGGDAVVGDIVSTGELTGGVPATVSGDAALEEIISGGELYPGPVSIILGDTILEELSSSGSLGEPIVIPAPSPQPSEGDIGYGRSGTYIPKRRVGQIGNAPWRYGAEELADLLDDDEIILRTIKAAVEALGLRGQE